MCTWLAAAHRSAGLLVPPNLQSPNCSLLPKVYQAVTVRKHQLLRLRSSTNSNREPALAGKASGYWTLESPSVAEVVIKKSKFIATAWSVQSVSQAVQLIESTREPGATHNCWAFKVGSETRSSDDGEPSGTAGRPILSAIQGLGLDRTCVMVTRYYGGVKLGASGLVHAYKDCAQQCLEEAAKVFIKPQVKLRMELGFDNLGAVYHMLERYHAVRDSEEYTAGGQVVLVAAVDLDMLPELQAALVHATKGSVCASSIEADVD